MMSRHRDGRPIVATRDMVRRRRRRRALTVLALLVLAVGGVAWGTWRYIDEQEFLLDARCEVQVGEDHHRLSPEQSANAAFISAAAMDRGLPREAASDALAIALQESDLQVLEATDEYDARELFRGGPPNWSDNDEPAEVATSVDGFYDALESAQDREDDAWTPDLDLAEAAEVLDRPIDPSFYPQHAERARAFSGPLTGSQPVGMSCHMTRKDAPDADPDGLAHDLAGLMHRSLEVSEEDREELAALVSEEADEDAEGDDEEEGSEEDGAEDEAQDEALEFGPILVDREDAVGPDADEEEADRGPDAGAVVVISMPESEDEESSTRQQLWTAAHWAVATADIYGTQSVRAGAYEWTRDTGLWSRVEDVDDDAVTIGF